MIRLFYLVVIIFNLLTSFSINNLLKIIVFKSFPAANAIHAASASKCYPICYLPLAFSLFLAQACARLNSPCVCKLSLSQTQSRSQCQSLLVPLGADSAGGIAWCSFLHCSVSCCSLSHCTSVAERRQPTKVHVIFLHFRCILPILVFIT